MSQTTETSLPSAAVADDVQAWRRPAGAKPRIFSGMQPTGSLHLGNYLGALRNWIDLANAGTHDCIYCIVDYHAITMPYEIGQMQPRIFEMALGMLAAGLPPQRCILFVQSQVPAHTELAWVFNSLAMMGRLTNMTQYKDKSAQIEQKGESINAGLLTYPILQAADILVYKGEYVPVGEDQAQHLELSRELARRFNFRYGPVFPDPQMLSTLTPRIMGLDGQSKMSKSLGNQVGILDTAAEVEEKFTRRASSDPNRKRLKDPGDPDICYVYQMHRIFGDEADLPGVADDCRNARIGCFACKQKLARSVNALLEPIRQREAELRSRPDEVWDVLSDGARRARVIAEGVVAEVRDAMGLTPPR